MRLGSKGTARLVVSSVLAASGALTVMPDATVAAGQAAPGVAAQEVGSPVGARSVSPGNVFGYGIASLGSLNGITLNARTVGITATSDHNGYWLVGSDGGVFSFGDASFYGSTGGVPLVQPVVGMAPGPGGAGYWLVASDGGVFSFGSAHFYGSTGGVPLASPIVAMAATPDGGGYWLVAGDGGVFTFGDAHFYGSTGGRSISAPIVGMATTTDGGGYWLVGQDGAVYSFGDAVNHGSAAPTPVGSPAVGIAASGGGGYWIATRGPASTPFWPDLQAYIKTFPETVTAAVEDLNTGEVYTYNPGLSLVLGSTVKVQILGTLLSEAQAQGRWLTPTEISEATAMIEISDNSAGQALFDEVGGANAVQAWDATIGLTNSFVYTNWGLSTSSATDQLTLLNIYANPNRFLTNPYRLFGLNLLKNVELSQIFGINVGPPESGVQAVKTGRIPDVGAHNAIGWIKADGRNYLIAALVQGGPSDPIEEAAIEPISVDAWVTLGP